MSKFKSYLFTAITLLLSQSVSADPLKSIAIDNSRIKISDEYALFVSGICKDPSGRYGLIQFSTDSATIKTAACAPQANVSSDQNSFFAAVPPYTDQEMYLQLTTPIKSGRFYFYLAKKGTKPDWVIFNTTAADKDGNFGLIQPNIERLLTESPTKKSTSLYPFGVIEITKDGSNYYADGTLIDGVSPLFASITKQDSKTESEIISGYNIPDKINTDSVIETIIAQCNGSNAIPDQDLCQKYLSVKNKTDALGNNWLIAPTEIGAANLSNLISSTQTNYLKKLDGISWAKSTFCGTFKVGDGTNDNCPKGTLCSTLGQYSTTSQTCFDYKVDAGKKTYYQYPIMFNSANDKTSSCNFSVDAVDGKNWMSSPCWDVRTVYAPGMPAASHNCKDWQSYQTLSKLDSFLVNTGVPMTLTASQQQNRGACNVSDPQGKCPFSLVDCKTYISSIKTFSSPTCTQNNGEWQSCLCPIDYTQKFPSSQLCQDPESINAITSWISVFLAASPDMDGLTKACQLNGATLLTPDCVAQYITDPSHNTISYTTTNYFSGNYYAWLLQFLYVDSSGNLTYPSYDATTGTTTISDNTKSNYLSGYGPTYVFPFSDFVSGDKALLTWSDSDDNATITIKLIYDIKK